MEQSVIIKDVTFEKIVANAEAVVSRGLTETEKVFIEYAVDQIRLGLV